MKLLRNVALLALLVPAAGLAGEADPSKGDSGDRRVCFVEARTGSNIKQRVCMTERERERRRKEDQEALRALKHSSSASGTAGAEPKIGM
jgi:hypothetical protein